MCRWMASSTDATAPSPKHPNALPTVTVVDSPPPGSSSEVWKNHVDTVRSLLARNRVVVVQGVPPGEGPCYEWNEESLCCIVHGHPNGTRIEWHCR